MSLSTTPSQASAAPAVLAQNDSLVLRPTLYSCGDSIQGRGCCAANHYCTPYFGLVLALVLLLVGPRVVRRLWRRHVRSSVAEAAGVPAPLAALWYIGSSLMMIGIASIIIALRLTPVLSTPWRLYDSDYNSWSAYEAMVIFPLGLTLMLLSLRPSLGDAKYVVRLTLSFVVYAAAATALFVALAIRFPPRLPSRKNINGNVYFGACVFLALAHLLVFLVFLPILRQGSLRKPPTRQLAAWRLRRFWRNWRLIMCLLAIVALALLIVCWTISIRYSKARALKNARLLLWSIFVEGVLFSLLPQHRWRLRLLLMAGRHNRPHRSSRDDAGYRNLAADDLAQSISQSVLTPSPAPVASAVDWPEQPPGLGARLLIRRAADAANHAAAAAHTGAVVELGRGGFSVVLSARLDGQPVAVKVAQLRTTDYRLTGDRAADNMVAVFHQEARLMQRAGFRHPHLCAIVGTCAVAGCPALVLECYSGGSLSLALGLGDSAQLAPELASFMERWRLAPQLAAGLVRSRRSRCFRRTPLARPFAPHKLMRHAASVGTWLLYADSVAVARAGSFARLGRAAL